MGFMDKLPTVISCCFCCFLRAGTVMIALFSLLVGLFFAPNITQTKGFWDMEILTTGYGMAAESAIQMTLGVASVMLCLVSLLLIIGALCNLPVLIEIYQWGALVYSGITIVLFFILIIMCFFVHSNSNLAGGLLCLCVVINVIFTAYFIMVTNSLRVSLKLIAGEYDAVVEV